MQNVYKMLLFIGLLVLFIFVTSYCIFIFFRAANKLYRKTNSHFISWLISYLVLGFLYFIIHHLFVKRINIAIPSLKGGLFFACSCLFSYPVILWTSRLFSSFSKKAPKRMAGPRRTRLPLKVLAFLFFLAALCLVEVYINLLKSETYSVLKTIMPIVIGSVVLLGIVFIYYSDMFKSQPIEESLFVKKNYTLYLRGFVEEDEPFYFGKYLAEFSESSIAIFAKFQRTALPVNLEVFISKQLKIYIGEMIGLGNPERRWPYESGQMIYTLDD